MIGVNKCLKLKYLYIQVLEISSCRSVSDGKKSGSVDQVHIGRRSGRFSVIHVMVNLNAVS